MPADTLEWIELNDFTPGIHGDMHAGLATTARGAILKNGAATIADTYRCVADASGALIPLPKRVQGKTQAVPQPTSSTSYWAAGIAGMFLIDAMIGQYTSVSAPSTPSATKFYPVWVLYNMTYNPAGTGTPYYNLWLGREYREYDTTTPLKDFFWESSNPNTVASAASRLGAGDASLGVPLVPGGALIPYASATTATALDWRRGVAILAQGHFNHAAIPIVAGELPLTTYDADVSVNYPTGLGSGGMVGIGFRSMLFFHPDPLGAAAVLYTTNRDQYIPSSVPASTDGHLMIGHQGRIVTLLNWDDSTDNGPAYDIFLNPRIYYTTTLNLISTVDSSVTIIGGENPSGFGLVASLNTDELLIIYNNGGGLVMRGDLTNPTISNLRSIESVYGVRQSPVITPFGLVYCTPNGVFVYEGGETTMKISNQIARDFWNYAKYGGDGGTLTTPLQCSTHMGRLGWFHPYVCVPNNYLYDAELKSWWRLDDPTVNQGVAYSTYDTNSTNGKLFAFPYKITTAQTTVWDEYDSDVLASSYSWRSQPLVESNDRLISCQEIEVVLSSGKGTISNTVTVTLTGINENGAVVSSPATAFTFTGTGATNATPYIKRKKIVTSLIARHVQMLITSTNSGTDPAPKVHSVRVGYRDANRAAMG